MNQTESSPSFHPVVMARYAFLALAILKGITLGIAVEQGVLQSWELASQTTLVVVAAACAWRVSTAPKLWIGVGLFTYLSVITLFAFVDPKSLINAFFLKAAVIGVLIWAWYKL